MQGRALKAWRTASKYPLNKLAMALGVNQDRIRNWERELSRIPDEFLEPLAAIMAGKSTGVDHVDLTGVSELDLLEELQRRASARAHQTGEQ